MPSSAQIDSLPGTASMGQSSFHARPRLGTAIPCAFRRPAGLVHGIAGSADLERSRNVIDAEELVDLCPGGSSNRGWMGWMTLRLTISRALSASSEAGMVMMGKDLENYVGDSAGRNPGQNRPSLIRPSDFCLLTPGFCISAERSRNVAENMCEL